MAIDYVRSPDKNFENLPGWNYTPRYIDDLPGYEGLRLHYVDEGPEDGITFLCLHGEPTWGYLYRKMAKVFLEAGHRFVAPDFFGFGRSDKPVDDKVYTFDFHRNTILSFVERLNLKKVCLVVQDWGGIIGLTLPMESPDRYSRLLIMNTVLPTGQAPSDGFVKWRQFCRDNPDAPIGQLLYGSLRSYTQKEVDELKDVITFEYALDPNQKGSLILTMEEARAYGAPFDDIRFKAGYRTFPENVMFTDNGSLNSLSEQGVECATKARKFLSKDWNGDSFMAIGEMDAILVPAIQRELQKLIKGCPEPMLVGIGHFVQERGEEVATAALKHFGLS